MNTDIIKKSLHLGDFLQLAAGSFNLVNSGLVVIPDPDPGRNDQKHCFPTFYEGVITRGTEKRRIVDGLKERENFVTRTG